jgi:hypothetical protein
MPTFTSVHLAEDSRVNERLALHVRSTAVEPLPATAAG